MCGIAGIVSFAAGYEPTEADLRRMSDRIAHRGPDGEGLLIARAHGHAAGFVHRRLAILDPDERSNQPFTAEYQGRRVHLVFNGEIYNFRDLRRELEQRLPGFPWRTTGDAEVLLAAYFAHGERCTDSLLGMFAFAIFDERDGSLLLARDRMGQKPLYVAVAPKGEAVAFASELPALLEVPWVDKSVDEMSLQHYLAFGYTPVEGSIYTGIGKLLPAHRAVYRNSSSASTTQYYRAEKAAGTGRDVVATTKRLVEASVRSQLISDVPIGCFLSGGIDSSVVALCMKRAVEPGQAVHTFTARFDDPRYDESPFAAEVARHLGTEHHTFDITPDIAADLPTLAASYGEPFGDSSCLPTYYLARETRKHVKVALAGDGGDELFAGYDRYRAMALAERFGFLGSLGGPLARSLSTGHPKSRITRVARLIGAAGLPTAQRYESLMRIFPPGEFSSLPLTGSISGVPFPEGDPVLAALALDRRTYLDGDLLTKVDRASMRVNLEVRAPFMDHHLVSFAAGLSRDELFRGGKKGLLRSAFAGDLPGSVFKRPKMGFAVPIGEWFRDSLRGMVSDLLVSSSSFSVGRFGRTAVDRLLHEHQTHASDHSQRIFALVMLELWYRNRPS